MKITEYKQAYNDAVYGLHQTHLVALAASSALKDFPKHLPEPGREAVRTTFREALHRNFQPPSKEVAGSIGGIFFHLPGEGNDPIAIPALRTLMAQAVRGGAEDKYYFEPLARAQMLVMTLAQVEAFLGDSLKAACRRVPRLLRRGKQVTWERIIDAASWDALIEGLIEQYSLDFGWETLSQRIVHLRDDLGAPIATPARELEGLDEAQLVRHLIMHNGTRVSRDFLRRTGRTDFQVGERLIVSATDIKAVNDAAERVVSDVFVGIATKFFDAQEKDLIGVPQRGK